MLRKLWNWLMYEQPYCAVCDRPAVKCYGLCDRHAAEWQAFGM